jgi:hypothetical protein
MINEKIFSELINRGVITRVGLKTSDFSSFQDLQKKGFVTQISSDVIYDNIVSDYTEKENKVTDFLSVMTGGGDAVLPFDIVLDAPIVIEKDVTLDLNGHNIHMNSWIEDDGSSNSYAFWVKGGTLTINGNGMVSTSDAEYSMAVWVNGGNVVINDGKFVNKGSGCDLIYLSGKGDLTINGGYFAATEIGEIVEGTLNKRSAINIKDASRSTCNVYVKGGTFLGFNPADNLSEGPNTNFVVDGYETVEDRLYYTVKES